MAQFATAVELGQRLGITLDGDETTRATALLTLASGLIQDETGQSIEQATETVTRPGVWGTRLRLLERPVTAVSSVKIDGVALAADDWYLDGDELVRGGGWGGPEADVAIGYTHGYASADVPTAVKTTCLEVVARVWTNPASVQAESYGLEQITYGDYRSRGGMLLTEAEAKVVNDAIRRTEGSTVLR